VVELRARVQWRARSPPVLGQRCALDFSQIVGNSAAFAAAQNSIRAAGAAENSWPAVGAAENGLTHQKLLI